MISQLNALGKTGLKVPPIIFGTSALGNLYSALPFETKLAIVHECLKHSKKPVVFDCAGKYGAGLALEILGKCLNKLNVSANEIIISNKLGWLRTPLTTPEPTFEPGAWKDIGNDAIQDISYDGILKCWEQGTQLLGGEYSPSLVSVHDPDEYLMQAKDEEEHKALFFNIIYAYKALSELKKSGKIKAIGVGAKDWKIIQQIHEHVDLDWVMLANSLTIMKHPPELLDFITSLQKKQTVVINSAVFHAGFLTGGNYFDYVEIKPDTPENKARFIWREKFYDICRKFNVKPANACVKFAMSPPGISSIALNTSNPSRVKQNVESVYTEIPGEFWEAMRNQGLIDQHYPYIL